MTNTKLTRTAICLRLTISQSGEIFLNLVTLIAQFPVIPNEAELS